MTGCIAPITRVITPTPLEDEHGNNKHGGVVQIIFLSKWVICTFHVNVPGCAKHERANRTFTIKIFTKCRSNIQLSDGWYGSKSHVFQYDSIGIRCSEESFL